MSYETLNFELSASNFELDFMVIQIPIEDWIDLHTFSPKEIPSLLEDYLLECQKKGFKEVRIIHGKGKGVQMNIVHSFLEKSPLVESFKLAPPEAGSWGATIACLKKPQEEEGQQTTTEDCRNEGEEV
jgi:DNA-nicking Smr family endonuclease